MRILAIDSSTEWCSVAVDDGGRWHTRDARVGAAHSERLLPMVRELLAEAGFTVAQLDGIAFGAGPGSFTGLRIGCGVAQGLAFAKGLPVVAVPTLEALACEARRVHGWPRVLACLDARMHEVYAALYDVDAEAPQVIVAPVVTTPAELALPGPGSAVAGAGNGFAAYPELAARLGLSDVDAELRPTARAIGELARPQLAAGLGVAAADALPLYVRHRVALTTAEREAGIRL